MLRTIGGLVLTMYGLRPTSNRSLWAMLTTTTISTSVMSRVSWTRSLSPAFRLIPLWISIWTARSLLAIWMVSFMSCSTVEPEFHRLIYLLGVENVSFTTVDYRRHADLPGVASKS